MECISYFAGTLVKFLFDLLSQLQKHVIDSEELCCESSSGSRYCQKRFQGNPPRQ